MLGPTNRHNRRGTDRAACIETLEGRAMMSASPAPLPRGHEARPMAHIQATPTAAEAGSL